jgi:hypothetical protein
VVVIHSRSKRNNLLTSASVGYCNQVRVTCVEITPRKDVCFLRALFFSSRARDSLSSLHGSNTSPQGLELSLAFFILLTI